MDKKEFDLNIEKVLENWSVSYAIREVIANALDEQVITQSPEIKIYKDRDGIWHIRDYGRGIKYSHLTQNENLEKLKNPHLIGKFGVGLKDALATFDRHNIGVIIDSKFGRITIGKDTKHGFSDIVTLHAFIDTPISPEFIGTDFSIIGCSEKDIIEAKSFFLKFSSIQALESTEFGDVYEKQNGKSDIYINGIKVAKEDNFLFSYNITSLNSTLRKALNRERTNIGRTAYSDRVRSILLNVKSERVINLLTNNLGQMSSGKQCDELKWIDVQTHVVKLLHSQKNTVFVTPEEIKQSNGSVLEIVKTSGKEAVFIPETVKRKIIGETDLQGNTISTISTVVQDYNNSFSYSFVPFEKLTNSEKQVFQLTPKALELIGAKIIKPNQVYISEKLKQDLFNATVGLYESDKNRIIILRSQLSSKKSYLGTLIHEVVHAETGCSDISRDFETVLTGIIGSLTEMVIENKTTSAQRDKAPENKIVYDKQEKKPDSFFSRIIHGIWR